MYNKEEIAIKTKNGEVFILHCDSDRFEVLSKYNWSIYRKSSNASYYAKAWDSTAGMQIYAHHLVIGYPINGYVTDHRDKNGLNVHENNLRVVSERENSHNLSIDRKGSYPGVHKKKYGFESSVRKFGQRIYLGHYKTAENAFIAYCEAVKLFDGGLGEELLNILKEMKDGLYLSQFQD